MTGGAYEKGNEAIRLAHNLAMAEQIARQNEHNEQLRMAVNGEAIPELREALSNEGGEEMGARLSIDSPTTITNHYHGPEPNSTPAEPKPKKRKLARVLGLAALGAGLLGAGAAIPFGLRLASELLDRPAETTPAPTAPEPKPEPKPTPSEKLKYSLDLG